MFKYLVIGISAFILELASTMYIANVSDRSVHMIFWAAISPFLCLPFVGFMVESNCWKIKIYLAISQATGYAAGAAVVFFLS